MTLRYRCALDKILKFCFSFCSVNLFDESSYIQRQKQSGRGHNFFEYACFYISDRELNGALTEMCKALWKFYQFR